MFFSIAPIEKYTDAGLHFTNETNLSKFLDYGLNIREVFIDDNENGMKKMIINEIIKKMFDENEKEGNRRFNYAFKSEKGYCFTNSYYAIFYTDNLGYEISDKINLDFHFDAWYEKKL